MKTPANYGEMIANYVGGTLWSYEQYGGYEGDYVAIIYKDRNLLIYKGGYGSCGGCDFLADRGEEITKKEIKEYMKDNPDFLTIPEDSFPESEEEFIALLPANTRTWQDDDYEFKLKDVLNQIKNPTVDNLDLIETEAKNRKLV
jgi:hypothetical protein